MSGKGGVSLQVAVNFGYGASVEPTVFPGEIAPNGIAAFRMQIMIKPGKTWRLRLDEIKLELSNTS
jgi:hypothetical protein